jgi:hypothetical protein
MGVKLLLGRVPLFGIFTGQTFHQPVGHWAVFVAVEFEVTLQIVFGCVQIVEVGKCVKLDRLIVAGTLRVPSAGVGKSGVGNQELGISRTSPPALSRGGEREPNS